jgi:crotonobetainyl-CoA:carnitine CoA-transferase CaiB-like acyl-CoA transferase
MADALPLAGVRILDFTWLLAGAGAPRILAYLGAQVIRVESRNRLDFLRFGGPRIPRAGLAYGEDPEAMESAERGASFFNHNAGKLGVTLRMQDPRARALIRRLVPLCDVVMESFRPGTLDRWGFGYDALRRLKPDIIYTQASGWGSFGPYHKYASFGPTAQAVSGLTHQSGLPAPYPPAGWGFSYLDHSAAYYGAMATLTALYQRKRTGNGQHLDLAQAEIGLWLSGTSLLSYSANGRPTVRTGNRSPWRPAAPHNLYPCVGQDNWVAIACFTEAHWRGLCAAMAHPAWSGARRFATLTQRLRHVEELDALVTDWTGARDRYAVMTALQGQGVPAGVAQRIDDRVERDPALDFYEHLAEVEHPEAGRRLVEGTPIRMSRTQPVVGGSERRAAPLLGQHNAFVFGEILGLSGEDLRTLGRDGVFE